MESIQTVGSSALLLVRGNQNPGIATLFSRCAWVKPQLHYNVLVVHSRGWDSEGGGDEVQSTNSAGFIYLLYLVAVPTYYVRTNTCTNV